MFSKIIDTIIKTIELTLQGIVNGFQAFATKVAQFLIRLSDTIEAVMRLFKDAFVRVIKED